MQIQEFSQNFILSIQQYADTSREIKFLFEMFFLNDNPNIHKLSFYLKNRKILSNYIYFVKSHTVVLDEVDLSMCKKNKKNIKINKKIIKKSTMVNFNK